MRNLNKLCGLFLIVLIITSNLFGQSSVLPHFKKGEAYTGVRVKMIKAGWKPYHAKNSDNCIDGDSRCEGRPEMHVCSGTGLGNCEFLWKRAGKTVSILTVGDDAEFSSIVNVKR